MKKEELSKLQYQILHALFFAEPLSHIAEEIDVPLPVLRDELRTMIDRGWVQVMVYDEKQSDYVRTAIFDTDHMENYRYLATGEGLSLHSGL